MKNGEWVIIFREVELKDKEFILKAHEEINNLSSITNNSFERRIDKDLFEDKIFKSIIAEIDDNIVWMLLYSYIYRANHGKWIYLSQAYVKYEYRGQGIYKQLIKKLETKEYECNFITGLIWPENEIIQKALEKMNFKSSDLITYYRTI